MKYKHLERDKTHEDTKIERMSYRGMYYTTELQWGSNYAYQINPTHIFDVNAFTKMEVGGRTEPINILYIVCKGIR